MTTPFILKTTGWSGRFIGLIVGALAVLGQAPSHYWPITLLSLAVLFGRLQWAAEQKRPGRAGFSTAFWWGLGYFAAGTYWVGSAFIERGPEFIPIMPFMVGALACVLALFWGLAGAFVSRARASGFLAVIGFAAAFTLAELARGHIWVGFPWNLPGYIFEAGSRPSQMARWIGAYGLSALVLLISAALGQAIFWRKKLWPVLVATSPVVALFAVGHIRLVQAQIEEVPGVNLRIVSVPFKQSDKMNPETSVQIVNDFIRASLSPGLPDVTHLVWPEGAVNGLALEDEFLLNAVGASLITADNTPPVWLMNSLVSEMERGRTRYYNASVAVTFNAQGIPAVAASNRKQKLVPFGENIPFMDWMEDVQFPLISTNLASISPGKTKRLSDFPGLPRVSPQLCFEVVFSGFTPKDPDNPPEFILNQSNDAWFGRVVGPAQHANIARYRAIETGLPIVRAASNGVSGVIDPYGRHYAKVEKGASVFIDSPLIKPLTFKGGFKWISLSLLLISISICVIVASCGRTGVRSSA